MDDLGKVMDPSCIGPIRYRPRDSAPVGWAPQLELFEVTRVEGQGQGYKFSETPKEDVQKTNLC